MYSEPRRLRRRSAPRRWLARTATATAMLTAVLGLVAGVAPAAPASAAAVPAASLRAESEQPAGDTVDPSRAELLIVSENPLITGTETQVRFEVLIRNRTDEDLPGATIEVTADPERIDDLARLGDSETVDTDGGSGADTGTGANAEAGSGAAPLGVPIAQLDADATPAGEEQRVSVTVPIDALPFGSFSAEGVYAVRAALLPDEADTEADTEAGTPDAPDAPDSSTTADAAAPGARSADPLLVASTPVIWRGAGADARVPVTLVIPLVLPERITAVPTRAQLAEVTPKLDELVTAAEASHATLAIDPRIIAAIRSYGRDAPAAARNLLNRLTTSTLPMFLLQFADADPAAQSALGLEQLLEPTGLDFVTRFGRFDGTAAAGGDPADAATPSLEQLLALPQAYPGSWPAVGEADAATLELLRGAGLSRVLLDSGNVSVSGGTRFSIGGGESGMEALTADAALGSAARPALAAADPLEQSAARAQLAAALVLRAQQQSTGAVLALDRGVVADAADPAELVDWLGTLGWVSTVPETMQPIGTGALVAGETTEQRRELLRAAQKRSADIDALAPLLVQPEYLTQYQRTRLLGAFAARYAEPGTDFATVIEERRGYDEELLQGVQVVTTANTQLVGVSSQVPVQLHNGLPFDALVSLHVAPLSAGIAVTERKFGELTVAAEGNTTVLVPVNSRISSGDSALLVRVGDAAGEQFTASATLPLTIRSSFETILLATLGGAAALLFGFGIWRSVRRRRLAGRSSQAAASPGSAE